MYTTLCDIEVNCQYLLLVPVFWRANPAGAIQEGEELLISYGDKLWFKDVDDDIEESVGTAEEVLGSIDSD